MPSVREFMTNDHQDCDELFAVVESAVAAAKWDMARSSWERFEAATLRHFAREEDVLFPAFERSTGMVDGPTAVMRAEHADLRSMVVSLGERLDREDGSGFLGLAESMMIMIQQHNMKEEQVLYTMADQLLSDPDAILAQMSSVETSQE